MTENPATSTNDAAALLGAVRKAQSSTSARLRVRLPEFMLLGAATCLGAAVGYRHRPGMVVLFVGYALAALWAAWYDTRRRRNVGGDGIAAPAWILAGAVVTVDVFANLALHDDAKNAVLAVGLVAGLLVMAMLYRNALLLAPAALIAVAIFLPSGALNSIVSFAAGLLCVLAVGFAARKRSK